MTETEEKYLEPSTSAARVLLELDSATMLLDEPARSAVFQGAVAIIAVAAVKQAMKKDPEFGRLVAEALKNNIDQAAGLAPETA